MKGVVENPHAPAQAPTQSMEGAVLVEETASTSPAAAPAELSTARQQSHVIENPRAPAGAPTQSMEGAVLVEESPAVTPERPAAAASPVAPPAPASARRVGLPARPRLRLTFGWDGAGGLTCEGVLMDERRELVAREHFDPNLDPNVAQAFSYFASRLVHQVRQSGADVYLLASSPGLGVKANPAPSRVPEAAAAAPTEPAAAAPAETPEPAATPATPAPEPAAEVKKPEGCICSRGTFDENGLCTVCGGKQNTPPAETQTPPAADTEIP